MTGQLRTTMHTRADALDRLDLDLDAIVRDGNRRLRRRRTALVAGGAALALVTAGTAFGLHGRGTTAEPMPADQPTKALTYAVGSVIHTGDGTIDVGRKVESMVQTARGFVFSDPDLNVYEETNGDVQQIGHLAHARSRLLAGDDGLVATWYDGHLIHLWPAASAEGNRNTIDPRSTAPNGVNPSQPGQPDPYVEALSDGHLWLWDGQGTKVVEVRPTPSTAFWPDQGLSEPGTVQDAAGDRILVRVGNGLAVVKANLRPLDAAGLAGWAAGTDLTGVAAQVPDVSSGDLAPDGAHWFTQDADQFAVFASATGKRQDVAFKDLGFQFAAPYQWLDSDTIAALALPKATNDPQPISLLTCHVSTNDCVVTARDIGDNTQVAVPVGESLRQQ
ncbi:hypothetical protein [Nocardioides cynanchi]|uniref:hypothetical protein n=1 Tax=Nocardioides cynanchi TaxID=2558918 RepID=UPI001244292E|nr:hypothetical protein [Nocardioides cynanchi]